MSQPPTMLSNGLETTSLTPKPIFQSQPNLSTHPKQPDPLNSKSDSSSPTLLISNPQTGTGNNNELNRYINTNAPGYSSATNLTSLNNHPKNMSTRSLHSSNSSSRTESPSFNQPSINQFTKNSIPVSQLPPGFKPPLNNGPLNYSQPNSSNQNLPPSSHNKVSNDLPNPSNGSSQRTFVEQNQSGDVNTNTKSNPRVRPNMTYANTELSHEQNTTQQTNPPHAAPTYQFSQQPTQANQQLLQSNSQYQNRQASSMGISPREVTQAFTAMPSLPLNHQTPRSLPNSQFPSPKPGIIQAPIANPSYANVPPTMVPSKSMQSQPNSVTFPSTQMPPSRQLTGTSQNQPGNFPHPVFSPQPPPPQMHTSHSLPQINAFNSNYSQQQYDMKTFPQNTPQNFGRPPPTSTTNYNQQYAQPPSIPGQNFGQAPPPQNATQTQQPTFQNLIQPPPQSYNPAFQTAPPAQSQPLTSTSRYPQQPQPWQSQPPMANMTNQGLQMSNQTNQGQQMGNQTNQGQQMGNMTQNMGNLSVSQTGFSSMWGMETIDLMQCRKILPAERVEAPQIKLLHQLQDSANCSPDIFRCTMTKIPETNNLLQKTRLPLGVLIHPFRDLNHLPVIQCSTIVRCRACRTYINPFVYFVDSKKWKCNLCYRVNELPEEFQFDPVSKSYGDPTRRPEIKSATIEFIAPSEYMLRPPQPAVYLFLFDTSRLAVDSGYLHIVCRDLQAQIDELPGDGRMQVGIICYNSHVHFYNMGEGLTRAHELTVVDIEDVFLPCPDNLLVNLTESKSQVLELLAQLPSRFDNSHDTGSALGAALQVAYKLMASTGGRITVFQTCLPNMGPGQLKARENPNNRSSTDVAHLGPATDFYKRMALDCSGQQIAVDLFLLNSQYADLATLSGISRFSGGCIYHIPLFKADREIAATQLSRMFVRYLTRKIGFEAVMRVRCTRGMSIHTFHGNFFVRSTDLLSLPNVNPDAGFGMQLSIDESLQDVQTVCLQAALLYTSSKGERRIRVHTICLPVTNNLSEIMHSADQQCIIGLLSKMAVDRCLQSNLSDARDAFMNVCVDILGAYKMVQNLPSGYQSQGVSVPQSLKLLPLYIHALLKHLAFRVGQSTRLDDRVFAMCEMKTLPLDQLMKQVYPDFYPLHYLHDLDNVTFTEEGSPLLPRIQLSAEQLSSQGIYLLDCGTTMLINIGSKCDPALLQSMLGAASSSDVPDYSTTLSVVNTKQNEALHAFVKSLNEEKPYSAILQIVRDDGPHRTMFTEKLIDDRMENSLSYYEFLQHLKTNIK